MPINPLKLSVSLLATLNAMELSRAQLASPLIIGVMDSLAPASLNHTALNGYLLGGHDFVNEGNTPGEHGISVFGVATGVTENPLPSSDVKFYAVKVAREKKLKVSNDKEIPYPLTEQDIQHYIDAIVWLEAKKTRIALMSPNYLQSFGLNNNLQDKMCKSSILFVVPAGNEHLDISRGDNRRFPASFNCSNILAIGALDGNGNLADFSNFGETVHVGAPGVNLNTTVSDDNYALVSGTSVAAPYGIYRFAEQLLKNGHLTNPDLVNMAPDLLRMVALDASGKPIPKGSGNANPNGSSNPSSQGLSGDRALIITWAIVGPLLIGCGIAAWYYRKPLKKLLKEGRSASAAHDPELAVDSHPLTEVHNAEQILILKYGSDGYDNRKNNGKKSYIGNLINEEGDVAFLEIQAKQTQAGRTPVGELPFDLVRAQAENGTVKAGQSYNVTWQGDSPVVTRHAGVGRQATRDGASGEHEIESEPQGSGSRSGGPSR